MPKRRTEIYVPGRWSFALDFLAGTLVVFIVFMVFVL